MQQSIIAFEDRPNKGIFRFLRKGFRHCYIFFGKNGTCRKLDPMNVTQPVSDDYPISLPVLMAALAACQVATIRIRRIELETQPAHMLRPLTCVEWVKRLTGIERLVPITPWQLFRALAQKSRL